MKRFPAVAVTTLFALAQPLAVHAAVAGDLDTSFNSPNGFRTLDIKSPTPSGANTCDNSATHVLVQSDGKIVLGGGATSCTPNDIERMVVVRLNGAGNPDSGFGTNGRVTVDGITTRTDDGYYDGRMAFDLSENIYLFNGAQVPGGATIGWVTARLSSSNGALDAGWAGDGTKDVSTSGGPGDVGVQSSGKVIVLDDYLNTAPAPDNQDMRVCRYSDAGATDAGFGSGGCTTVSFDIGGSNNDFSRIMKILPDDRILIAGRAATSDSDADFAIALLTADGDLDSGFGGGTGKKTVSFGLAIGTVDEVRALDQDEQGRFYAGGLAGKGESVGGGQDCALVRLLPNGDPDPAYGGGDGKVNFDYTGGSASWEQIFGMAVQGDGRLIVAGRGATGNNQTKRAGVARLDASGNLDPTFAGDGATVFNFSGAATPATTGRSVALQQDGFIVISGVAKNVADNDFFAARIYNDYIFGGSFDRGDFSGWLVTP